MRLTTKVVAALAVMAASSGCNVFAWRPFANLEDHSQKMPIIDTRIELVDPTLKIDYDPKLTFNSTFLDLEANTFYEIGDIDDYEFDWGFDKLKDKKLGKFYK